MKMYSSRTKGKSVRRLLSLPAVRVLIVGALVLGVLFLAPRLFVLAGNILLTPVAVVEEWVSESPHTIAVYLRDRSELLRELRELRAYKAEQTSVDAVATAERAENDRLRALLSATTSPRIAGRVIAHPPTVPYDVLILDRGSTHGVTVGAPVFTRTDRVIGFVAEVLGNRSVVTLATAPGFTATAYIFGPDIYTTAEGMGGGTIRVSVPQGIELREGNTVVLPALDRGVFGTVAVVESEPTRPEQYGYVTLTEPISSLSYVGIGTEPLSVIDFETAKEIVATARNDLLSVDVPEAMLITTDTATTTRATSTATTTETTSAL